MKDPTEILTTIASRVLEVKSTGRGGPWSFRDGVRLFINPEARCPDCEGWFPTNRVWLVDEPWNRLLDCWHMDGRKVDRAKEIIHPHVSGRGICMGNNKSASEALFVGVTPGKHYFNTERWFWQLGHDCPKVEKDTCYSCGVKYPTRTGYKYGELQDKTICSMKCLIVVKLFRCWSCFGERPFYEPDGNSLSRYCESCYLERTIACGSCSKRILKKYPYTTLPTGEAVCDTCRPDHYDNCRACEEEFLRTSLNDDRLCVRCENEIEEREEEREEEEEEEEAPPDTYPCDCYCGCTHRVNEEGARCEDCPPPDVEEEEDELTEE